MSDEQATAHRTGGLLALASAAFVYVTAETLPVGLLPQLASGLHVHEGAVGLLVTAYAVVAGLAALPVTALLEHRPRRQSSPGGGPSWRSRRSRWRSRPATG